MSGVQFSHVPTICMFGVTQEGHIIMAQVHSWKVPNYSLIEEISLYSMGFVDIRRSVTYTTENYSV